MGFVVLLNSLVLVAFVFKVMSLHSKEESDIGSMLDFKIQLEELEFEMQAHRDSVNYLRKEVYDIAKRHHGTYSTTVGKIKNVEYKVGKCLENSRQYSIKLKQEIDKLKEGKNV